MDTWLKVIPNEKGKAALSLHDRLFYVRDRLKDLQLQRWVRLGNRPLPVPRSWNSPDGNRFVLTFEASELNAFYLSWLYNSDEVTLSPGVKAIGADGGDIELPGVGTYYVPEGVLREKQMISVPQIQALEPLESKGINAKVIGPVIEILPYIVFDD